MISFVSAIVSLLFVRQDNFCAGVTVIGEVNAWTSNVMNLIWLIGTFTFAVVLAVVTEDIVATVLVSQAVISCAPIRYNKTQQTRHGVSSTQQTPCSTCCLALQQHSSLFWTCMRSPPTSLRQGSSLPLSSLFPHPFPFPRALAVRDMHGDSISACQHVALRQADKEGPSGARMLDR